MSPSIMRKPPGPTGLCGAAPLSKKRPQERRFQLKPNDSDATWSKANAGDPGAWDVGGGVGGCGAAGAEETAPRV